MLIEKTGRKNQKKEQIEVSSHLKEGVVDDLLRE